jgi:hypothetical protein
LETDECSTLDEEDAISLASIIGAQRSTKRVNILIIREYTIVILIRIGDLVK